MRCNKICCTIKLLKFNLIQTAYNGIKVALYILTKSLKIHKFFLPISCGFLCSSNLKIRINFLSTFFVILSQFCIWTLINFLFFLSKHLLHNSHVLNLFLFILQCESEVADFVIEVNREKEVTSLYPEVILSPENEQEAVDDPNEVTEKEVVICIEDEQGTILKFSTVKIKNKSMPVLPVGAKLIAAAEQM